MRAGGELPPAFFLCPARVIARIPVIVYALNYPPEAPLAHNRRKRPSHGGEARARPCMPGGRLRRPWAVSAPLTAPRPAPSRPAPRRAAPPPQFSTTPAPIPSTPRPITTTAPLYIVTSATQGWKSIGFSGEGYNAKPPGGTPPRGTPPRARPISTRGTPHAARCTPRPSLPHLSPPFSLSLFSLYI